MARNLPFEEQVRIRAFEIFMERGGSGGSPEEDWLRAEAEIRRSQEVGGADGAGGGGNGPAGGASSGGSGKSSGRTSGGDKSSRRSAAPGDPIEDAETKPGPVVTASRSVE